MNPFEKSLRAERDIPLDVASSYFLELRQFPKTASAPEEVGDPTPSEKIAFTTERAANRAGERGTQERASDFKVLRPLSAPFIRDDGSYDPKRSAAMRALYGGAYGALSGAMYPSSTAVPVGALIGGVGTPLVGYAMDTYHGRYLPNAERAAVFGKPGAPSPDDSVDKAAAALAKIAKEVPTDEELKETGRQRGVTAIAAEHERERSRRGERAGKAVGTLGGAAAGGALGRRIIGGPAGTLGGAVLGGLAGRGMGGELGTEVDIARAKTSSISDLAARMAAWVKTAQEPEEAAEAPMSAPTAGGGSGAQEQLPSNYLQAEAIGQEVQNTNEANYFREKARAAEAQAAQSGQAAQEQLSQMQMGTEQLQMEADSAAQRIQAALQEAMKARDEALQQTEIAANMRLAMQKQRQTLMELASQDPAPSTSAAMSASIDGTLPPAPPAPPVEPPMEGQAVLPEGAVGADRAPVPNTAPGSAPAAGAKDMNAPAGVPPGPPPESASPAAGGPPLRQKTSAAEGGTEKTAYLGALAGAVVGAAAGAGSVYRDQGRNLGEMQERLSDLQRAQDGSYGQAAAAARLQKEIADTSLAQQFPGHVAARRAAGTALNFGLRGAGIEQGIRRMGSR